MHTRLSDIDEYEELAWCTLYRTSISILPTNAMLASTNIVCQRRWVILLYVTLSTAVKWDIKHYTTV